MIFKIRLSKRLILLESLILMRLKKYRIIQ